MGPQGGLDAIRPLAAMDEQLNHIRQAYDLTAQQYHDGIDPLDQIPDDFRNSPELAALLEDAQACNSGAPENREFLAPKAGTRFLDVGCAASLVNYHLYRWESTYFGVDISSKLIAAMGRFVLQGRLVIGGLSVAELAALPFPASSFDMAAVIGVLEYCSADYMVRGLSELHRVLKPEARLVLDIPNLESPHVETMFRLEECLQRKAIGHSRVTFERSLESLFSLDRCDDVHVMLKYFCRAVK
ncbi:MAG: class I SAM-dependent methyltransferase [Gemmatimonadota bacterium]|nr:MAG: class I SAM-dependent methyltransferase [Gemmatimonadota bacterium]